MNKNDALLKLQKKGYVAALESNVIYVELEDDEKCLEELRQYLKEIGYLASFGYRPKNAVDTKASYYSMNKKDAKKSRKADTEKIDGEKKAEPLLVEADGQISFFSM